MRRAAILVATAGSGMAICSAQPFVSPRADAADQMASVSGCRVTDGDTIRCGSERIRLLGIDAPELPGHCRRGRLCAPGDPQASKRNLDRAMSELMTIERVGRDRYGRTLALVSGRHGDLSCWQLRKRQAIYKPQWDDGGQVATTCPNETRPK